MLGELIVKFVLLSFGLGALALAGIVLLNIRKNRDDLYRFDILDDLTSSGKFNCLFDRYSSEGLELKPSHPHPILEVELETHQETIRLGPKVS